MKEIPILFSSAMVQAILAGRKTMTRRIKGLNVLNEWPSSWVHDGSKMYVNDKGQLMFRFWNSNDDRRIEIPCPYGKPGDILWVRETIYQNGELGLNYVADNEQIDEEIIPVDHKPYRNYAFCNIPCIHMPKWAARIWLEVTDIKVERLQDITEEDAIKEGVEELPFGFNIIVNQQYLYTGGTAKESFSLLWKEINGAESWDANPWVWCISFNVLLTTGKPELLTQKTTS